MNDVRLCVLIGTLHVKGWRLRTADVDGWLSYVSGNGKVLLDVFNDCNSAPVEPTVSVIVMLNIHDDNGDCPIEHVTFDGTVGEAIEYVNKGEFVE